MTKPCQSINFILLPPILFLLFGSAAYCYAPESLLPLMGGKVGGDFANIWIAARQTLSGNSLELYDIVAYQRIQHELFGPDYPIHNWSYPPHLLLFLWPLGALPYEGALIAWLGLTMALFLASASPWFPKDSQKLALVALAIAPASLINILVGQTGFLTGALLLSGLWLLRRRPILSGLCFALLTIKPQLGLLIPLVVLAGGHWRVFASAALGTSILVALSLAAFGLQPWLGFLGPGSELQVAILTQGQGIFTLMMPTVFIAARLLGLPTEAAMAMQLLLSLCIALAVYRLARRRTDERQLACFLMLAVVAVSPYAFNYDMTVVSLAALLVLLTEQRTVVQRALWIMIWLLPIIVFGLNAAALPLAPVILSAGLWQLWCDIKIASSPGAAALAKDRGAVRQERLAAHVDP